MKHQPFIDNWFRYGYNDSTLLTKRTTSADKFFVNFDEYSPNHVLSPREAFNFNNINELI